MKNFVSNFNQSWILYPTNLVVVISEDSIKRYHQNIFANNAIVVYADHKIDSVRAAMKELTDASARRTAADEMVLVVDGADMMTMATASVVLKYLERPAAENRVVLRFAKNYNVPETLTSRASIIICEPHDYSSLQRYGESIGLGKDLKNVYSAVFGFDDLDMVKKCGAELIKTLARDIAINIYTMNKANALSFAKHTSVMNDNGIPTVLLMKFVMHYQNENDYIYDYVITAEAIEKIFRGHNEKHTLDQWLLTLNEES